MNNKRKIILLTSTLAATSVIALTSVFALGSVSPLSAEKGSRQITATGANTIHVTYQTSTPGYPDYRRIILFEMLDKQAYGYVTPSQAQTVDDDDSFLMTMWHAKPSGAGFVINSDEHSLLDLYLDEERTKKVELVKFRNIEKVEFIVDTSDDKRYVNLECTSGSLAWKIVDENTKVYTWTPASEDEYQQTRICGASEPPEYVPPYPSRVLWIRSMTFYYSC